MSDTSVQVPPAPIERSEEEKTFLQKSQSPVVVALRLIASLKITVTLFFLSALLVWFGTLAQTQSGLWTVVDEYFRSAFVMIKFDIFEIFFPSAEGTFKGAFPFPGGWLLGALLLTNLLAAHTVTFKFKANKNDALIGGVLILVGVIVVAMSILGVFQSEISATEGAAFWRVAGRLIQGTVAAVILWAGCHYLFKKRAGIVLLHAGIILMLMSEIVTGLLAVEHKMLIEEGETVSYIDTTRSGSLNNLGEYELAIIDQSDPEKDNVTVVPQHFLTEADTEIKNDLLPFNITVKQWMENTTFVDKLDELQARIQQFEPMIQQLQQQIGNAATPPPFLQQRLQQLQTEVIKARNRISYANEQGWPHGVTKGAGLNYMIIPKDETTGVDTQQTMDAPAVVVELTDKATGESLGTYLMALWFYPNYSLRQISEPQQIEVGGKRYTLFLRNRRVELPYQVELIDFNHELYPGTNRPKDFSSVVKLRTPEEPEGRELKIWMNNPLRYDNKTFYQASFFPGDKGTVLQVVENRGWMIPYLSCMIVAVGMLAVFGSRLMTYLRKRASDGK